MTEFVARKHRYADGVAYQGGRFVLYVKDEHRGVGGMLKVGNKFVAFAGPCGEGHSLKSIQRYPHVWGDTAAEALTAIRPHLEHRL